MKSVVYDAYGAANVARVREVPAPTKRPGTLLVRVAAAALNPKDVLVRKGKFKLVTGFGFPRTMGYDWAGEVVSGDATFPEGTKVFGMIGAWSGGAFAELARVSPNELARMPEGLTFVEAASLPLASLTALQALRDEARVVPGHHVLLHGASGGVGVLAVQIAKALGAHVTTTSSEANRALLASLGADETLDYRALDFAKGEGVPRPLDAFFDIFGNQSFARVRPFLGPEGTYVSTVPSARVVLDTLTTRLPTRRRARLVVVQSRRSDLEIVARLVGEKKLRPVVDAVFPLDGIVQACERIETKRARGKVVLTVP